MTNPNCCGQQAKWVRFNDRLQYWFCEKCKNEVQEHKNVPFPTEDDDNNIWYPGLAPQFSPPVYTTPAPGTYTRTRQVTFSGAGGGGGGSGQPPAPTPMGSGEVAQFTNGIDTPCYNNHIHCWMGKTSYDMGIACTCGQRVKALTNAPPPQPQVASTWPSVAAAELLSATQALAGMTAGSRKKLVYNGAAVDQLTLEDAFDKALYDQGLQGLFSFEVRYGPPSDEYFVTITKNY